MLRGGRGGKIRLVIDDDPGRVGKQVDDTVEKVLLLGEGVATGFRGVNEKEDDIC